MATLHLPDVEADRLLEVERVRIGWNHCRVQERMVPMRCFQCLRFGHLASRCAAEKRVAAGSCLRCGKKDIYPRTVRTISDAITVEWLATVEIG
jgi:hypothetical protein